MIRRRNPRFYKGFFKILLSFVFKKAVKDGNYIAEFESRFASYLGSKYAISVSSGRLGMEMIFNALEFKKGDEIIVSSYTLKDLINIIFEKGLIPKFVDIEPDSFNINPALIEQEITPKTKAIIATHIFGLPCDILKISDIAGKHGLKLIEDCAHSLGASCSGRKTGSFSDAAFFSFEVTKQINTFGGGMVVTSDPVIASNLALIRQTHEFSQGPLFKKIVFTYFENLIIFSPFYFFLSRLFMHDKSTRLISRLYLLMHRKTQLKKIRFTNLQSFIGLKQLENLDSLNAKRNSAAQSLSFRLPAENKLQKSVFSAERVYYFFVVRLPVDRNIVRYRAALLRLGIDAGIRWEITDDCASLFDSSVICRNAKEVYDSALQLPLFDDMIDKQIEKIIQQLIKVNNG